MLKNFLVKDFILVLVNNVAEIVTQVTKFVNKTIVEIFSKVERYAFTAALEPRLTSCITLESAHHKSWVKFGELENLGDFTIRVQFAFPEYDAILVLLIDYIAFTINKVASFVDLSGITVPELASCLLEF